MADPDKAREAWLSFVRPAADRGKLETLRTVRARTPKERDTAQKQNYWLSKKSYGGYHANYDLINWSK
jgi:hypothetical protein